MVVREAGADDALPVRRILDAAMLEPGDVETRIEAGDVLVACDGPDAAVGGENGGDERERILGALVLEPRERGAHVSAIAVRRRLRDDGLGTALVEAALDREGRLTARFDRDVVPFYESLGFAIEPIEGRRYRGRAIRHG